MKPLYLLIFFVKLADFLTSCRLHFRTLDSLSA